MDICQPHILLKQSTAGTPHYWMFNAISFNLRKEKKGKSILPARSLGAEKSHKSLSILENSPLPFSPTQEKCFFPSQCCSLSGFCHSFPSSRSTKFPGRFLSPPTLPPLGVDLKFFAVSGCFSGLSRVVG